MYDSLDDAEERGARPRETAFVPRRLQHGRPATFAQRGVTVPFTSPSLSQARIRMDNVEGLECLLPAFSGGQGTYVIGWRSVPDVLSVTLHDRALHREIAEARACSPDAVRKAALTVSMRGFAGLSVAEHAKAVLQGDQRYAMLTTYTLILELLRIAGISPGDLLTRGVESVESRRAARDILKKVAQRLDLQAEQLYTRVENISTALAPLGLPQAELPGRLRTTLRGLSSFYSDVSNWAATELSDVQPLGLYMAECARQTLGLAAKRLERIDLVLRDVRFLVTGADRAIEEVTSWVSGFSWLLDGWDYIIQVWSDCGAHTPEAQRSAMVEIHRLAPMAPLSEVSANENVESQDLRGVRTRRLRPGQDWRGTLDLDGVQRIEAIKAKLP